MEKTCQGGKLAAQALLLDPGGPHHGAAVQHHTQLAKLHGFARLAVQGVVARKDVGGVAGYCAAAPRADVGPGTAGSPLA